MIAGYSAPKNISGTQVAREDDVEQPKLLTELADVGLTMFTHGHSTIVRVGNAHNSSELYEMAFDSLNAANAAMLESGILTLKQVPSPHKVAGLDLPLTGITVEQLEDAGFKRQRLRPSSSLLDPDLSRAIRIGLSPTVGRRLSFSSRSTE